MKLHCLGTAGFHPNQTRHTSCYFQPESGLCLDAGTGMFRLAPLVQGDRLDILLSHAHLDHTFGLTVLLDVLHQRPVREVNVYGLAEKLTAIQTHLFSTAIFPVTPPANWVPIDEKPTFHIGGHAIRWLPQPHPGGSVAYRIDFADGRRLVYATDTAGRTDDEFTAFAGDADLLAHECNFTDEHRDLAGRSGHSTTSRVAEVAALARPKRLLITHINPLAGEPDPVGLGFLRERLRCDVLLAEDGLEIEF